MRSCPLPNSPSDAVAKRRYLRDLVRSVPWLAQLSEDELDYLLKGAKVHAAEGREWLFRQQTPAHWIYVVVSGAVRLLRATDDGRLETIRCVERHHALLPSTESTLGPSRYYRMADSDTRIGFISPHSHNFCDACNRVRVTAEGRLLLCLGNEHSWTCVG